MTETLTPIRGPALSLGSELTIAQAAQHRETLVDAVAAAPGDLQLDQAVVSEIDSGGVQLLQFFIADAALDRDRRATAFQFRENIHLLLCWHIVHPLFHQYRNDHRGDTHDWHSPAFHQ